jgi:hypothetical protein
VVESHISKLRKKLRRELGYAPLIRFAILGIVWMNRSVGNEPGRHQCARLSCHARRGGVCPKRPTKTVLLRRAAYHDHANMIFQKKSQSLRIDLGDALIEACNATRCDAVMVRALLDQIELYEPKPKLLDQSTWSTHHDQPIWRDRTLGRDRERIAQIPKENCSQSTCSCSLI